MVDTTVDTVDTDTVMNVGTSARGPLMPNPRLRLMPTMAMAMAVDTMVDTTAAPTVMATDTSARGPLMPNPKLTTDTDMAVPTDTTVDTTAVVDTTGDKLFIQDQVTRNLSNLANFDKFSSFFHQSLPSNI